MDDVKPTLLDIPDNADYSAANTKYDDGGMGPMFDFARSFINTALPGGFPKDFINGKILLTKIKRQLYLTYDLCYHI